MLLRSLKDWLNIFCYALSGTDRGYATTDGVCMGGLCGVRYWPSLSYGTDIGYGATYMLCPMLCYAVSGADMAYGPTMLWYLTLRRLLRCCGTWLCVGSYA
eukprot:3940503-Rhodomonas_salina.5